MVRLCISFLDFKIAIRLERRANSLKIAIYPGTFDPMTNGHLDIIERTYKLGWLDKLIVAVRAGLRKSPLIDLKERLILIREIVTSMDSVEVDVCDGLLVDYARAKHAAFIIRGIRNEKDFALEMEMAVINKSLAPHIETLFIPAKAENIFISSSAVKEIASLGGDVSTMAPAVVQAYLRRKI
jgi:pantetheine-phosphate adenylyltransferase